VQLLDRHGRDCRAVAEQLGVAHYEVPEQLPPGAPFEVLPLLRRRWWHEIALWYPEQRTLVCADAVGTAQYYRAPGERLGVSPLLRLTPPRRLLALAPEHVLVGHGEGIHRDAPAALGDAVRLARRRRPSWAWAGLRGHAPGCRGSVAVPEAAESGLLPKVDRPHAGSVLTDVFGPDHATPEDRQAHRTFRRRGENLTSP
jgi:glyoxylase-like metal-dependent hydrolase (beta-lactamase superfamily II)